VRSETTRLLALARPYRALLAGALVCSFIASALDGITIVLLVPLLKHLFGTTGPLRTGATPLERWLSDTFAPILANTTPGQAVGRMAIVLGVGLLLRNLAEYLSSQFNTRMQEGLVASLRRTLYDHLMQLDLGFFHRTRTGLLVTALINETDQAKGIVTASMVTLIRNVFLLATTLFILASISVRLTLLSLIVVPPLAIGLRLLTRRIRRHSLQYDAQRLRAPGGCADEHNFFRGLHHRERGGPRQHHIRRQRRLDRAAQPQSRGPGGLY